MISICRDYTPARQRWGDGQMGLASAPPAWPRRARVPPGQRPPAPALAARTLERFTQPVGASRVGGMSRPPNEHQAAGEFQRLRDILCVPLDCYFEAYRTWVAVVMGYLGHFGTGGEIAGAVGSSHSRVVGVSVHEPHLGEINRGDLLLGGDPFQRRCQLQRQLHRYRRQPRPPRTRRGSPWPPPRPPRLRARSCGRRTTRPAPPRRPDVGPAMATAPPGVHRIRPRSSPAPSRTARPIVRTKIQRGRMDNDVLGSAHAG